VSERTPVTSIEIQDPNFFGSVFGLLAKPTKTVLHLWSDGSVTWEEVER